VLITCLPMIAYYGVWYCRSIDPLVSIHHLQILPVTTSYVLCISADKVWIWSVLDMMIRQIWYPWTRLWLFVEFFFGEWYVLVMPFIRGEYHYIIDQESKKRSCKNSGEFGDWAALHKLDLIGMSFLKNTCASCSLKSSRSAGGRWHVSFIYDTWRDVAEEHMH
jgi:hypothetical protein